MRIGITGTIGSGKSTVTEYIKSLGFNTFSCDEYNAYLLQKGNEGYLLIKENFPEVFDGEELNKSKLSSIVFKDLKLRKKLESLLHPLIINEMDRLSAFCDIYFAEVPLLFESGLESHFDKTLLITVDEDLAIDRLINRGLKKDEAIRRMSAQMSVSEKKKRADEIIYNNSDLNSLYKEVDKIINKYVG